MFVGRKIALIIFVATIIIFGLSTLFNHDITVSFSQPMTQQHGMDNGMLHGMDHGNDGMLQVLESLMQMFKFAPKHNFSECTELFSNSTEAADFQMSAEFNNGIQDFLAALNKITKRGVSEGHSYRYKKYFLTLHYLAKELDFVKTVCETGFNAGHSAFNFLSAKPSTTLHSFDIGRWKYTALMAGFLKIKYANRFNIYLGDSTKTLPAFIKSNSETVSCNLVHVDGGHFGAVPLKDLENFSYLANLKNNIVFMDNVNYKDVGAAWNTMVVSGVIRPLLRCKMHHPGEDEMAIGTYVRRTR